MDRPVPRWYDDHVRIQQTIPRGDSGRAMWARQRGHRFTPARFDEDIARQVPDRRPDTPPRGILEIPGAGLIDITGDGRDKETMRRLKEVYAGWEPEDFGITALRADHPEALAAARLRLYAADNPFRAVRATWYVNERPCSGPAGCEKALAAMLPNAARLTTYGPGGYLNVARGIVDPPRRTRP